MAGAPKQPSRVGAEAWPRSDQLVTVGTYGTLSGGLHTVTPKVGIIPELTHRPAVRVEWDGLEISAPSRAQMLLSALERGGTAWLLQQLCHLHPGLVFSPAPSGSDILWSLLVSFSSLSTRCSTRTMIFNCFCSLQIPAPRAVPDTEELPHVDLWSE